jgi:hypothetical protein
MRFTSLVGTTRGRPSFVPCAFLNDDGVGTAHGGARWYPSSTSLHSSSFLVREPLELLADFCVPLSAGFLAAIAKYLHVSKEF